MTSSHDCEEDKLPIFKLSVQIMPIQHVALHSNYLRRTLAMDPDSTTLDLDSGDNTTGAQETLQVPLHQDIENCSLQDAFKAFREKRRVSCLVTC